MPRSGVGDDNVLVVSVVVYDRLDGCPGVLNVIEVTPKVAMLDNRREVRLKVNKEVGEQSEQPKGRLAIGIKNKSILNMDKQYFLC